VLGDGPPQPQQPRPRRVLVVIAGDGPRRRFLDEVRRGEIRKALAQVDGPMLEPVGSSP